MPNETRAQLYSNQMEFYATDRILLCRILIQSVISIERYGILKNYYTRN